MTSQDLYCSHTIIQIVKWNKTSTSHLVWKRKFGERRGRKKGNKELTLQGRWHQQWKRYDEPEKGFLHHTRRTNRSVLHFLTYSMHQQQREIQSLVSRKWRSQEENEETPESYLEVIIPSCECEFRYKSLRVCISPFVRMSCHLILTSNLPCPVRTFSQSSPSCQSYSLSFFLAWQDNGQRKTDFSKKHESVAQHSGLHVHLMSCYRSLFLIPNRVFTVKDTSLSSHLSLQSLIPNQSCCCVSHSSFPVWFPFSLWSSQEDSTTSTTTKIQDKNIREYNTFIRSLL